MGSKNTDFIRTLNQERAKFALEKVKSVPDDKKKKFKTNGERLSSLIVSNGLIPTLAFLKAKEERKPVYDVLNEWLKKKGYCSNDALEELVKSDFSKLRLATMEALEFSNWLKRMIEVELKDVKE